MRILMIVDETNKSPMGINVSKKLLSLFKDMGNKVIYYDMKKEKLNHCIGCFKCWIQTPGICTFNDAGRRIAKDFVQSDIVIFISPVKYGCYSAAIRRVMDRLLPDILPFFRNVNDELHHTPRYEKYPDFIIVGYGEEIPEFEIDTFKSLADANAINFMKDRAKTYVCRFEKDLDRIINSLERYLSAEVEVGI